MRGNIKIISALLTAASIAAPSASAFAAYTDVSLTSDYCAESVNRLQDLGVIDGYEDGSYDPYGSITRAEFAKMVVCVIDEEDTAIASGVSSSFNDVSQSYWAVPYIQYTASQGYLKGYADGSFGAENRITYAEAVTVLVRLLGYSESDLGYYWPNNYIAKAEALGLADGIGITSSNDYINRAQAAVMIDRILFSDVNTSSGDGTAAGSSSKQKLLETLDYTIEENVTVLATADTDSTLLWNEIKTMDNTVYMYHTVNEVYEPASVLEYAVFDEDGYLVAVKGNDKGDTGAAKLLELGYTVLSDALIIGTSSDDKTLSNGEVRTSSGVYSVNSDVDIEAGDCADLVINRDKTIISAVSREMDYAEYIISEVNDEGIQYVYNNEEHTLSIADDYPIYVDYGAVKSFSRCTDSFTSGAKLTFYTADGETYDYAVLDTNSGYSVLNDCFIIASKNEDKTLTADQVRTSSGTYKTANTDILNRVGDMGTVIINDENKIEQFAATTLESLDGVITKITGSQIEYQTTSGTKSTYTFTNSFVAYVDYEKTTYGASSSALEVGTSLTFYGPTYGNWEFVVVDDESTDIDPVRATRNYSGSETTLEGITIDKDNLTVYRDGKAAELSDIQKNDVVYYNTKTNVMDVYCTKVTGIYYDAQPSKAYVEEVTVGGKTYTIGYSAATSALDASSGAFEIGEKVTLLLGKNDEIAFAVELDETDLWSYGVVVNTGVNILDTASSNGKSERYARMFMPDGNTYEYVTDKDYSAYKGKLVSITYNDDGISISGYSSSNKIYGDVDLNARTIGTHTMLKDGVIIQRISNDDDADTECEILDFDLLDVSTIHSDDVLASVTSGSFADISLLYIDNVTSSGYTYGILKTKPSDSNGTSAYTIWVDGSVQSYTSSVSYSYSVDTPVKFVANGGSLSDMSTLYKYASGSVQAIDSTRLKMNNTLYTVSSSVVIAKKNSSSNTYEFLSMADAQELTISNAIIYSDKSLSTGGTIKYIIITNAK